MTPSTLARCVVSKDLRDQGDADCRLGARADAGEKAEHPKLQRGLRQALAGGEQAEQQDAERQGADTAKVVRDNAKPEAADRPSQQAGHGKIAPKAADLRGRRVPAQQVRHRGAQHEREQAEIRRVQRPAQPGDQEHLPLVGTEPEPSGHAVSSDIGDLHDGLPLARTLAAR